MGLVADVVPTQINGQTWHRLVVPGYASQEDAKAIAADLKGRGLGQPWVYQRKSE
jgi:septal ring-binding cell division protein DamX